MIYKVVPAAMVVEGSTISVADYFEKTINREARAGWQFYSMETATAEENGGCSFNGPTVKRTTTYLLIFCKPSPGAVEAAPGVAQVNGGTAPQQTPATPMAAGPRSVAAAEPQWTCANCGTSNKASYGMCKKCGSYRGAM